MKSIATVESSHSTSAPKITTATTPKELRLSKGKVTVVSGVLEDSLVSGDGFLEGLSLFLDGLLVSRDGGSSFGEGVGSGSGSSSLGLIGSFFGNGGIVMGF